MTLLLLACAAHPGLGGPTVTAGVIASTAIGTVGTATWQVDPAVPTAVEFGIVGEDRVQRTALRDGGERTATLWGVPPRIDVWWRVVDGAGEPLTEDQVWTTGLLDPTLPDLSASGILDPSGGWLVAPLVGEGGATLLVLDADGRTVWGWRDPRPYVVARARLSQDRTAIVYEAFWMDVYADLGEIVRVPLDGGAVTTVPVPLASHDFVELPDGSYGTYVLSPRDVDGTQYVGDQLVEIAPDGTWRVVWDAWEDPGTPFQSPEGGDLTWSHANALDFNDTRETYQVGLRNLDAILTIDRASGEVVERLGGPASDFTFAVGSRAFDGQHQFELTEDRALVFDNGSEEIGASRAVEYALDGTTGVATEVWVHEARSPLYVFAGGDVHRDESGGTCITWTTDGTLECLDADGTLRASVETPLGQAIAFTTWEPALQPE